MEIIEIARDNVYKNENDFSDEVIKFVQSIVDSELEDDEDEDLDP